MCRKTCKLGENVHRAASASSNTVKKLQTRTINGIYSNVIHSAYSAYGAHVLCLSVAVPKIKALCGETKHHDALERSNRFNDMTINRHIW
mmetsp:Transcript_23881/g.56405  ORF Transcript_23881/g.56405 Transcript_23881/m.56405 type:complete len:90 (-) Transcript_23881:1561-1830(-)